MAGNSIKNALIKFGFHVSISGSIDKAVDRAVALNCDTFQIFTQNPRRWKSKPLKIDEVEAFKKKWRKSGIDSVFGHMPYILNLASPNNDVYSRSLDSLTDGLNRCSILDVPMLVTHIGSHLGIGSEKGIHNVIKAIDTTMKKSRGDVTLLLENGSGSRNKIGSSFEELSMIIGEINYPERVGICLDTCHVFSTGHDIRTLSGLEETLSRFDDLLGIRRIELVHLNDSIGTLGSGIDHHEHIGLGKIGVEGFRVILGSSLNKVPMIMETPIDERRGNMENMRFVKELANSTL
jgi:deoxyribonuclease-4